MPVPNQERNSFIQRSKSSASDNTGNVLAANPNPQIRRHTSSITNESGIASNNRDSSNFKNSSCYSSELGGSGMTSNSLTLFSGCKFDIENEEDITIGNEIEEICSLFENESNVFMHADLTAVFINYLLQQNRSISNTIFCILVDQFEDYVNTSKEKIKDSRRLAMEIYSTFLHEKSPLYLNLPADVHDEVYENILNNQASAGLTKTRHFIIGSVEQDLNDLKDQIRHGMETWKPRQDFQIFSSRTHEESLTEFDLILYPKVKDFENLKNHSQQVKAIRFGLASIYRYFQKKSPINLLNKRASQCFLNQAIPGSENNSITSQNQSPSINPLKHTGSTLRNSKFARSIENINFIGNSSKRNPNQNLSFSQIDTLFNSKYKQKSNNFFTFRRHTTNGHTFAESFLETALFCEVCGSFFWGPSPQFVQCSVCETSVHESCKHLAKENCTKKANNLKAVEIKEKFINKEEDILRKDWSNIELGNKKNQSGINNTINFDVLGSRTDLAVNESVEKMENGKKLKSEDQNSLTNPMLPELVTIDWSHDAEMSANESFDHAVELRAKFPNYEIPENLKSEEHKRMLVLLEFHQKLNYMVYNLKLYDYLLLSRWPSEHNYLAELYCLDKIPDFIALFKSLVKRIEGTMSPEEYTNITEEVYKWLTEESGINLKKWKKLAQAIICINQLKSVKADREKYIYRHPELQSIIDVRYNKFTLTDGISNIRGILFNTSMIARNIHEKLSQKTKKYKDEGITWKKIYDKLSSVPESVNNVIDLVKMCNSGNLVTNVETKDINRLPESKIINFIREFPRSLFNNWVIAWKYVTVEQISLVVDSKTVDYHPSLNNQMIAVLLEKYLVLFVKDGNRYVFKGLPKQKESVPFNPAPNHTHASSDVQPIPLKIAIDDVPTGSLQNLYEEKRSKKFFPMISRHNIRINAVKDVLHLSSLHSDPPIFIRLRFSDTASLDSWLNSESYGKLVDQKKFTSSQMSQSDLRNKPNMAMDTPFRTEHISQGSDQITYLPDSIIDERRCLKLKRSLSANDFSREPFLFQENNKFMEIMENINYIDSMKNKLCSSIAEFVGDLRSISDVYKGSSEKYDLLLAECQVANEALELLKRTAIKIIYPNQGQDRFDQNFDSSSEKKGTTPGSQNVSRSSSDRKSIDSLPPDSNFSEANLITHQNEDSGVGLTENILAAHKDLIDSEESRQLTELKTQLREISDSVTGLKD